MVLYCTSCMCYCPTPTLHLNLALTGDGAFLFSLIKNSLCMIYKAFKLWGHWKCPHKSPSPCNTYVIPMSLYKFVVLINHINMPHNTHLPLFQLLLALMADLCLSLIAGEDTFELHSVQLELDGRGETDPRAAWETGPAEEMGNHAGNILGWSS